MRPKALVTGCAGFIGSHLSEALISQGYEVIGVDCLTDYYSLEVKKKNLSNLMKEEKFKFIENDILNLTHLPNIDYVFHLAAQPGVRSSWGSSFDIYVRNNIMTTQKLLEALRETRIKKFVYASSSSVYGNCRVPMKESYNPRPLSPYGATKLLAENLCYLYWKNYGVPIISLRYFTVYGPRQRPDTAFHKFIKASLNGEKIVVFGDGNQTRDFTFIDDVVEATILAAESELEGEIINIGSGRRLRLNEAVKIICEVTEYDDANVHYVPQEKGEMRDTLADISKAKKLLGYKPKIKLKEGIEREVEWLKEVLGKRRA